MSGREEASVFDVAAVRQAVAGSRFAQISFMRSTGSTNDDALPLLGEPSARGLTLCADYQTQGAGRKEGRRWIAPPGCSLLATTLLPDDVPVAALWAVPFWVGVCAYDAVARLVPAPLRLQWPNDLLAGGRKAAGILCVSRVQGARASVACGIGINVRRPADADELDALGAVFLSEADPRITREKVLAALLGAYEARWPLLSRSAELAAAWELRAGLPGERYVVRTDEGEMLAGEGVRLGPDGTLVLRVAGVERAVALGDATVVRA